MRPDDPSVSPRPHTAGPKPPSPSTLRRRVLRILRITSTAWGIARPNVRALEQAA